MNNKFENEFEINNVSFKFKILFVSSSEFEKKTFKNFFDFFKNILNQVNEKLILNFERENSS